MNKKTTGFVMRMCARENEKDMIRAAQKEEQRAFAEEQVKMLTKMPNELRAQQC